MVFPISVFPSDYRDNMRTRNEEYAKVFLQKAKIKEYVEKRLDELVYHVYTIDKTRIDKFLENNIIMPFTPRLYEVCTSNRRMLVYIDNDDRVYQIDFQPVNSMLHNVEWATPLTITGVHLL